MESIEAKAFKASSLVFESAIKPYSNGNTIGVGEDYVFLSTAGAGDDFSVDEFFDLDGLSEEEKRSSSSSSSLSLSSQDQFDEGTSFSDVFTGAGFFDDFSEAGDGLAIPADDIKELELWSHLMDDTHHYDVFACPTRNAYATAGPNRVRFQQKTKPAMVEATRFPPPVITRPRTKRQRHVNGSWSSSPLLNHESSSSSSVSSSKEPGPVQVTRKPVVKRSKTKLAVLESGGAPTEPVQQLKCTHCQVQKTPQWRTGPLGPKTLCNACGVRYKSGRLFPEYRPACSPTFSIEAHSNSHRKVLEMRKRKMPVSIEPALLQSF